MYSNDWGLGSKMEERAFLSQAVKPNDVKVRKTLWNSNYDWGTGVEKKEKFRRERAIGGKKKSHSV